MPTTQLLAEAGPAAALHRSWVRRLAAAAVLVVVVQGVSLLVEVGCATRGCSDGRWRQLMSVDAVGGLPRLTTTALLGAGAVLAAVSAVRSGGRARPWWGAVSATGAVLAVAKCVNVHTSLERSDGRVATLVGGVLLAAIGLPLLAWTGRRWSVAGSRWVCRWLTGYALAALGLDQVTQLVMSATASPVVYALLSCAEEGGEAVTALLVLAAVASGVPPARAARGRHAGS